MPLELFTLDNAMALGTLTLLEIVLGIDNIVVLAIVTGKLPPHQQPKARRLGLVLAMVMRILLLLSISWVMKLTTPLFGVRLPWMKEAIEISWKDVILILGGLFLIGKATWEISHKLDADHGAGPAKQAASFAKAVTLIIVMDLVFSLDSVITAVGMTNETQDHRSRLIIMIAAVVISMAVMLMFAGRVSRFVEKHPSITVLALSFLIMIGVLLVADGFHQHLNRGYVYFAMAFSLIVEIINLRVRSKQMKAAAARH